MLKLIGGRLWYCCPKCGQKIHPVNIDAECKGVIVNCRRCQWEGEMVINKKGA